MSTIHIVICRGIGETSGRGMILGNGPAYPGVIGRLPREKFVVHELNWESSYGPVGDGNGSSYQKNLATGMELLAAYVRAMPIGDRIILLGYSAGATLVGDFAKANLFVSKIIGVGLIADPMRPRGKGAGNYVAPGFGIGGERDCSGGAFPVWWISDPRDVITSAEENSPLRLFADATAALSFLPGEFPAWLQERFESALAQRGQQIAINWLSILGTMALFRRAADAAHGYLWGGDHTSYDHRIYPGYTRYSYTAVLANLIIQRVSAFETSVPF